ncbi:acidic leucine-rich nuclear phosphoprotein 32-related protein isoform X1 [Vigna radiata var. radiata]|uniref:Acidic leucine-rich nuclear phosphoprotein 32-related protein isoform X1 n=1 Tax=Vigna radiata var. radiata TaxID=3916 RepID=A0A3Q0F370_VIGRR|nr:acidic leucine-rich nuclear phosphoprotein 32-related protein isoform X1 [Vigna radiata var. radiata]
MRHRISYLMDEIWERAVETALDGEKDHASARTLTLDGAVKCVQGRLPPPTLLERFQNLQHLSIANVGVSTLEQFPRLRNLQKLNLSDNRIAGGLEFLVQAGLDSLRDLDLSNNRIQYIEDLAPLAQVKLVSLDLYECPVTRVKDYRSRVFGLIKSLKYLDKMDAEENERPESDDEEEEEEEEEEEDDPGSGEIDGEEDRPHGINNGHSEGVDGVVDADEEEESDADEEETETSRRVTNGDNHRENGFRVVPVEGDDVEEDDDEDDSGEEIDEEEGDDDDVVEVHEIEDSDDEDGVEYDEDDDDDDDDEEEVDNDEGDFAEPESTGRLTSTEGEIDGHEQGEEDGDEDDNGETGEDEMGVEDDGDFEDDDEFPSNAGTGMEWTLADKGNNEEDYGGGYLVQPVGQSDPLNSGVVADVDGGNDEGEGEEEDEVDDDDEDVQVLPPPDSSSQLKRKRNDEEEDDEESDDEDVVAFTKSSKKHH